MQLIKPDVNIDFVGKRKLAFVVSMVLILVGLGSLLVNGGPNYGIDFAGGTLVQVQFAQPTTRHQSKRRWMGWNWETRWFSALVITRTNF